jgi:acyl-coenzyme A synthetase/AMP-(fatty) acid ligase
LGRADDQAKRMGFRFSLLEAEAAAMSIDGVHAAACVKAADGSIELFAVVDQLTDVQIHKGLRERLEAYKVPDRVSIVHELPTTAHGKYDRALLAALTPLARS